MAGTQMIKVTLQRDSLQTPWGFRLQGGADFCMPFTVNKITAGSPADGILHRGDIILDIDQKPISSMPHADALELVQRAGEEFGPVVFTIIMTIRQAFSILLSCIFYGHYLSWYSIVGINIVFLAIFIHAFYQFKRSKQSNSSIV
ncbi:unnamed protein product [Rotaria sp. Silwood2]|nr:unnamed protein product [Rotaria sp. Silwood2]